MAIRWHLREVAEGQEITGYRLAALTGISAPTIYKLMSRKIVKRLDGDTVYAICKALQCQPGDLMDAPDIPPRRKARRR